MYEHVLSPLQIGPVEVKNRVVRTAHATGFVAGVANERVIAYHEARARGGVGLTILEIMGVHPSGPGSFMAFMPGVLDGHKQLMEVLGQYDMKVFQQLFHAGHSTSPLDGSEIGRAHV